MLYNNFLQAVILQEPVHKIPGKTNGAVSHGSVRCPVILGLGESNQFDALTRSFFGMAYVETLTETGFERVYTRRGQT
jgi:hypothetical protein